MKKIDYGNSKILVYAGKDQVFTADRVLLTIPLAVLRCDLAIVCLNDIEFVQLSSSFSIF